ncbi:Plug domain-containing protein [Phenylobacterium aquaticum]|uniref:Plug domain-containing protein n=1 Tax=Phenylobacterium aquaticum TaxID=1763816 RepID=UPI001F5C81EE|nr:Plug domain-containing protein [Phenylobacterium aquaticum]MCI3133831.1 Plug domain-containing protein [Phenylobacterium aquaticum]
MRNFTLRRRSALGVSLMALTLAAPALARAADNQVEELVVTARKRDEALIDVPFSVNAMSETKMRERGATNIEDISRSVAGFTVQNLARARARSPSAASPPASWSATSPA